MNRAESITIAARHGPPVALPLASRRPVRMHALITAVAAASLAPRFERRGLQAFTLLLLPWMIPNASQKDTLLKDAQADDPHAGSIMRRLFG